MDIPDMGTMYPLSLSDFFATQGRSPGGGRQVLEAIKFLKLLIIHMIIL
jgi:hypothetical protein